MAGRYAYAKQFKRMQMMNKKLKSRLGRIVRDIESNYQWIINYHNKYSVLAWHKPNN
ncbi:hypothetical protein MNB_SUP05-SYMBIONT-4-1156 [hydrothermal vent metagenome]|uniref:Uncharacterized protein n=1 Tax=hydrothermal vent metagenome TaxID=652676 RepID=A0A1W1DYV3_9ZZZZ